IEPGTTPIQLLNKLVSGDVILRSFTIVDGWTFHDMINALEQNPSIVHTLKGLTDPQIMQKIGVPGEIPEGRFYPDTYKFSGGVKDVDILRSAYKLMQSKLNAAWNNRAADAPYSCQYKALIAASIIEKEAAVPSERPIISGVIKRRLKKNMYLQMDPTVIYGLGDSYKGDLTVKDLRRNTPYNTYLHKRLPPTPICIPSIDAFEAALHPQAGKELYFVAKGDGTHEFSATLKEQDAAIRKYQLKKNPKKSS
ncbi:MAG: endolytic transglycosylase MltG, partial [Gammaproteobacteria bacterium]|nr:endolytic transglycosylase MltG [Gammaproteobacteria bacterium]